MNDERAQQLMRSAWKRRRESFELETEARHEALAEARAELSTALEILSEEEAPVQYAQALHLLANVDVDVGDEAAAQSRWEDAVQILRVADDPLQLAHKVRHLGDLHARLGRLRLANACYSEAVALYREHDRSGSLDFANALSRLAALREEQGARDEALALWRETLALYSGLGVEPGVADAEARIRSLS